VETIGFCKGDRGCEEWGVRGTYLASLRLRAIIFSVMSVRLALCVLRSVDRSVQLGRLGVCPECQMVEVGKRLDYNEVRTTERWINTQGESACQALKRKGGKGLCKVFQPKRMRCRDSTKYAQRGCIGEVAEALQSIQLGPSDTRSQSYRLLAKLSSLIY
jgi:hypothetical protein